MSPGDTGHDDAHETIAAVLKAAFGSVSPSAAMSTLYDAIGSAAAAQATSRPFEADLTAIAALSTTSYGPALLTLANTAALAALLSGTYASVAGPMGYGVAFTFRPNQ